MSSVGDEIPILPRVADSVRRTGKSGANVSRMKSTSTHAGSRQALKLDSARSNHRSLFPLGLDTVDTFSTTNPTSITYRFLADVEAYPVTRLTKMLETYRTVRYARSLTYLRSLSAIYINTSKRMRFPERMKITFS